ncbi:MAG: protein-disulfide reductase DsbD domain-containing protein [Saprospiraceae bacterium]
MTHKSIRTAFFFLIAGLLSVTAFAQNPAKWSFTAKDAGNCQVDLIFTGILDEGWYTYSQFLESEDGPVATLITFQESTNFKLLGKAVESGEIIKVHDPIFDMNLTKFKHKAILTQRVEIKDPSKPIAGYLTYMTCNDEMCLPPKDANFSFKIPALANCGTTH